MPDMFTHMYFAKRVLTRCGGEIGVSAETPAVWLGSFGPDPLFNDLSAARRAQGTGTHRRPGSEAMDRLRVGVRSGSPSARAYAAGFFTHYALDRLCHPDINRLAAGGNTTHLAIESRCEQLLRKRIPAEAPAFSCFSMEDCRAACALYDGISPGVFRGDLKGYLAIRRFINANAGKGISRLPGRLISGFDGFIARSEPTADEIRGAEGILKTLEDSVDLAAEQLTRCFDAIQSDTPLGAWCGPDFNGR